MVFCDFYPATGEEGEQATQFDELREAIGKLSLNDSSFTFLPVHSDALGFGFRCGFLGLLHLEIIQERLTREYDLELITTAPSVVYRIHMSKGKRDAAGSTSGRTDVGASSESGVGGRIIELHNPADMPDPNRIETIEEPWIEATIYVPDEYLGSVLKLCQDRRGIQKNLTYVGHGASTRALLTYELPLNEVVFDFYDRLKSISRGYASFDYHQIGHRPGDLVKMSILVNGEPVDALSMIVHAANAEARGRGMCERLKELIPRHLFKIPIQAAIGGKIIARETIAALRKDVTAKCYGGDATRKRKLLEKQKEGKKRMREYGSVSIPQEAFIAALRMGEE
jgi:GTP-binding protein LepA